MLKDFLDHIQLLEKKPSGKKFLLAVSGGLDSGVMTELFFLAGYNFSIAHCNFQLRGKESDEDEGFVKGLAKDYDVPFYFAIFDTVKFCKENKLSIQMGARQLRYDWLEKIRKKNKLDYVVMAHHADDAIETFFINLLRGTGISGLHGIKEKNENIIRPMLHFYRNEIEKFAKENDLKWREDSSNATDKYERNKIRHKLIPLLKEINPKAKESIASTIENIGRAEVVLHDAVGKVTQKFIRMEKDKIFIKFDFFKDLDPSLEYLFEVIKKYGFNYGQCLQIVECAKGQSGKIFLSESHRIVIDRDNLIVEMHETDKGNKVLEIGLELEELITKEINYIFRKRKAGKSFNIPREASTAALDLDKLTFPLQIRKWEKGDKFYPLGMKKPKKISDFLIDNKVALSDKDKVRVLVSSNEIAWLIGYRPDERFKITEATKNLYLCRLENTTNP